MKNIFLLFIATFFVVGVWGQTTVELTSIKDASIYYSNPNTSPDGGTFYYTDFGKSLDDPVWALIQFDLSSIPNDAKISSSYLYLKPAPGMNPDMSVGAYAGRATSSWSESVTWNTAPAATLAIPFTITSQQAALSLEVSYIVSEWIEDGQSNYGFMLMTIPAQTDEDNYWSFKTREYSNSSERPKLYITYTIPCDPPSQPGTISGNTTVCSGESNTYSIGSVANTDYYTWEYDGNGTPSGSGTSVNLSATSSGTLKVKANNDCGSSNWRTIYITVNDAPNQPGSISGNTTVCSGESNSYSIGSVANTDYYTWEYDGNGTPSGSGTSVSLSPTSSGTLKVIANNTCGSSTWSTIDITVNEAPNQPGTISGNTTICSGESNYYSIGSVANTDYYTWEYDGNGTPSGSGTSISLSPTSSGTLRVCANNNCGSSSYTEMSLTVNTIPTAPSSLTASEGTNCNEVVLSWTSVSEATYTIVRGSTTLEINYSDTTYTDNNNAPTTSTQYKVYTQNDCGQSSSYASDYGYAKTIADAPEGLTATDGTVCDAVELSWDAVDDATSYLIDRNGVTLENSWVTTAYTDNTAPTSTTQYKIYSKNECGTSTTYASDDGYAGDCTIIPFEENDQVFNIYPNPVSDKLFIETELNICTISICNELGQIILTQNMNNTTEISVSQLKSGVYILNAYGNEGELLGKFKVVKK